jgi:hypothetical protein
MHDVYIYIIYICNNQHYVTIIKAATRFKPRGDVLSLPEKGNRLCSDIRQVQGLGTSSQHSTCLQLALVERHLVEPFGTFCSVESEPEVLCVLIILKVACRSLNSDRRSIIEKPQDGLGHGMNDMGFSENLLIHDNP